MRRLAWILLGVGLGWAAAAGLMWLALELEIFGDDF